MIRDNVEFDEDYYETRGSDNPLRDNLLNEKLRLNVMSANTISSASSVYDYTIQAVTHKIEMVYVPDVLKSYFEN